MSMDERSILLSYLHTHKARFRNDLGITEIGLIGSIARGEANPESDVDLIVEFAPGTQQLFEKKNRLCAELETAFGRPVDLVRKRFLKPYYRDHILAEAVYG
jgi:predicted nucleotidyltransferase